MGEESEYFKKYIERFDLEKHNFNKLKKDEKELSKKVYGSKKGFNYSLSVDEGEVFLKGDGSLLFKTNKQHINFKITSDKVFYIEKPLYITNNILIKREAGNCFDVKIYGEKDGEDIVLNIISKSSFSSNKKNVLKLKKRSYEL